MQGKPMTTGGLRRNNDLLQIPAEIAINKAIDEVEKLHPHEDLTEVVTMLAEAKNKLADHVESEFKLG